MAYGATRLVGFKLSGIRIKLSELLCLLALFTGVFEGESGCLDPGGDPLETPGSKAPG